jgi:uncharacterized membrane protein YccF (DUF307 family)
MGTIHLFIGIVLRTILYEITIITLNPIHSTMKLTRGDTVPFSEGLVHTLIGSSLVSHHWL